MRNIVHLDETDSTNTWIKQRLCELPDGTLVTAKRQTAGRGRMGHVWLDEQGMLPLYGIFDGEVCSQHQARGRTVCVMCVSEYSESRLSVTLYRELPREAFNEAVSRMAESGAAPIRAQALMRAGRASSPRYAETLCRRLLSQLLDNSQNGDAVLPSQSGRVYN